MNNPGTPLAPQGSFLEPKNQGRSRVRLYVFFVLAIHVVGLMSLLIAGCRREPPPAETQTDPVAPPFDASTAGVDTMWTNPVTPYTPPPETNTPIATLTDLTPPPLMTEYIVVSGDNFTTIGARFGVSIRAIQDANPGVDPRRLQIGTRLKIPPPASSGTTAGAATGNGAAAGVASGEVIHTVVSGENLTSIGNRYGTTARALSAANNLTTDRITVGQKLKIPADATRPQGR